MRAAHVPLEVSCHSAFAVRVIRPPRSDCRPTRRPDRFRPQLECCEARDVPASFMVNSPADAGDSNPGDGFAWTGFFMPNGAPEVTLRAAVMESNALGAQAEPHNIGFKPLLAAGPATIILSQSMDDIRVPMTIDGDNKDSLTITRDPMQAKFSFFSIARDPNANKEIEVMFKNMTIRNADADGDDGGAIHNSATLTLLNIALINNKAASGGALFNVGKLIAAYTSFTDNRATLDGGAICGTGDSRILTSVCQFTSNSSNGKGGAIAYNLTSRAELYDTDLTDNSSGVGGAIYVSFSGADDIRALWMVGGSISQNRATGSGGGVLLSTATSRFDNVEFDGNSAAKGGAVYAKTPMSVSFFGCAFCENSATQLGPVVAYSGTLGLTIDIYWDNNCTGITAADLVQDV